MVGAHVLAPAGRLLARDGGLILDGAWRGAGRSVRTRWRFAALRSGVRVTVSCPRGATLRLVEWMDGPGEVRTVRNGLIRADRSVLFSTPVRARRPAGTEASAAAERVAGVRLDTRCTGGRVAIEWRAR